MKGCFYVGISLYRWYVSNVFGVRAVFNVDTSHIFLQGLLATITLIESMASIGGAKSCAGWEVGFLLCSVSATALPGLGVSSQVAGAEALRVRLKQALFLLSVFPSPHTGVFGPKEGSNELSDLRAYRGLMCCLCRHLRLCSVTAQGCVFSCCGCPRSSARLWHGVSRARAFTRLGLRLGACGCKN